MTRARIDAVARVWAIVSFVAWVVLLAIALGSAQAATADVEADVDSRPPTLEQRRDTPQTSVDEVGAGVMCPSCDTTLDQSNSPAADDMRVWIEAAVDAGWTREEIRAGLVAEYGGDESVLATPRASGLGLAAYLVPALVILVALVGGAVLMRRWRRPDPQSRSRSSADAGSSSNVHESSSIASASSAESAEPPSSSR